MKYPRAGQNQAVFQQHLMLLTFSANQYFVFLLAGHSLGFPVSSGAHRLVSRKSQQFRKLGGGSLGQSHTKIQQAWGAQMVLASQRISQRTTSQSSEPTASGTGPVAFSASNSCSHYIYTKGLAKLETKSITTPPKSLPKSQQPFKKALASCEKGSLRNRDKKQPDHPLTLSVGTHSHKVAVSN